MSEWNIKIGTTLDTSDARQKLNALMDEFSDRKINIDINVNGAEKLTDLKDTLKEVRDIAKSVENIKIDLGSSFGSVDVEGFKQMQEVIKTLNSSPEDVTKTLLENVSNSTKKIGSSMKSEMKSVIQEVGILSSAFDRINLELLSPNQRELIESCISRLNNLKNQDIKAFNTFELKMAQMTLDDIQKDFTNFSRIEFQTNFVDKFIDKLQTLRTVMQGMGVDTSAIDLLTDRAYGLLASKDHVDSLRHSYAELNRELRQQVTKPLQLTSVTNDEMGLQKLYQVRDEISKKIMDAKPGTDISKMVNDLARVENAINEIRNGLDQLGTETAKALDMKSLANQADMASKAMAKSAKEQEKYQKDLQKEFDNSIKRFQKLESQAKSLDMTSGVDVSKWRAINELSNSIGKNIEQLGDKEVSASWLENFNSELDTLEGSINNVKQEAEALNLEEKFNIDASKAENAINGIHASLVQLGRDTNKVDEFKTRFDSLKDLAKTDLGQASSGLNTLIRNMKEFSQENNLGDVAGTMKQLEGYVRDFNNAVSKSMSAKDFNLAKKFEDEARRCVEAIKTLLNGMEGIDDEVKSSFERMTSAIDSSDFSKQLQNLITDVNRYKAVMQNLNQNIKFDGLVSGVGQDLAQEFNQAIAKALELENTLQNMLKSGQFDLSEFNRLKSELEDAKARVASFSSESIIIRCDEAITNLKQLRSEMEAIGEDTTGVDNAIASYERLGNAVKDSAISVKDAMNEMKSASREVDNISKSFDKTIKSMDDMGSSVRNVFSSISDAFSSVSLGMMLEEGIETMVYSIKDTIFELDSALTEFARVAPDGFNVDDANLQQVAQDARQVAISVGQSVEDVIVGMSTALQAGATTMQQATAIAEKSAILQNVSDMDATSASQAISSMITQYYSMDTALSQVSTGAGKAVDGYNNLTQAIDMVNYAGNNFAISSQGVTEALQDGGSTLSAYGVTLSDSIALISGANESLQDPSRVGNGLKSIAVNLAGLKTSAKDGTIELNKTAMGLQEIAGIDIFTDSSKTNVKDMMTILDELNGKWGSLTEAQQLALSEGIAGKQQSQVFNALMQNWSRVKQFQDEYNKGWMIGSAQKENEIYLDSVAGKFNTLKENLKGLLTGNISTSMFKDLLDGANKVVVAIDKISQALGKIGSIGAVAGIASMIKSFQDFGKLDFFSGGGKTGILDTGVLGTLTSGFSNLKTILSSVWSGMSQGSGIMGSLKGGLSGLNTALGETGVKAKLAQVGMGLLNGVLTGIVVAVAITAIKGFVTALDEWINKSEKVVEASKEMQQSIQSEMQSLNTQKSSLSAIATEYDTLAQKSNKTAEEMKRLSELKKQIAEISPDLVVGYDANNDPILALKGSLTSYISELDNAIAKQQELYNQETFIQAREVLKENDKNKGKTTTDWLKEGKTDWLYNRSDKNQILKDNIDIVDSYASVSDTVEQYQKIAEQSYQVIADSVQHASQLQRENLENDAIIQQHYLNQWAENTKLSTEEAKSAFATFFTDLDWGRATQEQADQMAIGLQRLEGVTATSTTQMSAKYQQMTAEAKKAFEDTGAIQKYGQTLEDIARKSGQFDLNSWTGYLDEVNQRFSDGQMNMDEYRHALTYVADAMEHLTGISADTWLESFVDLGSVTANLESASNGLNKFMDAYGTSMSRFRSGDSFAVAVKEQFDALTNFNKNLQYKIKQDIPIEVEWLLEEKGNLPKQIQDLIDAIGIDGQVTPLEQRLLVACTTEIENEGQLRQETVDTLQKIFDGDFANLDMNAEITIGNSKFVVSELVEIYNKAKETKGGLEELGNIDIGDIGADELNTQIEEVRDAIMDIDNTKIRVAMDAQGFEKKEEIEITKQLIEGIDGEEAQVAFIAEAGQFILGATSVQDAIDSLPPEIKLKYQIGIEGDAELEALNAKYQALPKEVQTVVTAEGSDYTMHDLEEIQALCDLLGGEKVAMLLSLEGGAEAIHTADTTEERLKALSNLIATSEVEIEGGDEVIKLIDEICEGLDEADGKEAEPEIDVDSDGAKDDIEDVNDGLDETDGKTAKPKVDVDTEGAKDELEDTNDELDELDGKNTESNHTANSDDSDLDETEKKIEKLTQDTHGKITVHAETEEVVQAQIDKDRLEVDGKSITRVQVDGQGYYDVAINEKGQLEVNGVAQTTIDVQNGEQLEFAINDKNELEVNGIAITGVEIQGAGSLDETKEKKDEVEQDGEGTSTMNVEDSALDAYLQKLLGITNDPVEQEIKLKTVETIDNILSRLGLNKKQVNVEIKVTANTAEATKQINSIVTAKPGDVKVNITVGKDEATDKIKELKNTKSADVKVGITLSDNGDTVSKLKEITGYDGKTVNITVNVSAPNLDTTTSNLNVLSQTQVGDKNFNVNAKDNATSPINKVKGNNITDKNFNVNAKDNATSPINKVKGNNITDKKFNINAKDNATSPINKVKNSKISDKSFNITAKDKATGVIGSIKSALAGLSGKSIVVSVVKKIKQIFSSVSDPRVVDSVGVSAPKIANEEGYVASANNIANATDNMNNSMVSAMASSVDTYADTGYTIRAIQSDVDLLTNLKAVIDKVSASLSELEAQQKRTWGSSETSLLQQQIALLQRQQQLTKATENNMEDMADRLRGSLSGKGFVFNADGSIDNYNTKLITMTESVEKLKQKMDAYKGDDESFKNSLSDAYNKANDELTKIKEQASEYLDLTFNQIPNAQKEWEELANSIAEARAEIIKVNHEQQVFYEDVRAEIKEAIVDKYDSMISVLEIKADIGDFESKVKYMEQEIGLMQSAMDEVKKMQDTAYVKAKDLRKILSEKGFKFSASGELSDAEGTLKSLRSSMSDAEFEAIKDVYDDYVDTFYSTMPDLEKQWWDYKASIEETKEEIKELEKEMKSLRDNAGIEQLESSYEHLNEELAILEKQMENSRSINDKNKLFKQQLNLIQDIKNEQKLLNKEYAQQKDELSKELTQYGIRFDSNGSIKNLEEIMNKLKDLEDMEALQELADQYNEMISNINDGKETLIDLENQMSDLQDEMLELQKEFEDFSVSTWVTILENGLKTIENELELLESKADLYGTNMTKNWDKQIDKINELKAETEDMIKFYELRQSSLESYLSGYGFKINDDGSIKDLHTQLMQLKNIMSEAEFGILNEKLEEYFEINTETIPELERQLLDYEKNLQDIAEEKLDIAEKVEKEITSMIEKQIEDRIEEIEKEADARIEALNKAKDAYEKYRDKVEYNDDYEKQLEKVQNLQNEIEIAKRDTSLSGKKRLEELMEELKEEQENLEDLVQDKIDSDINDMFDDEIDRIESDTEKEVENIENIWSSSKIAEAVKNALATGLFEDIDGNIMALDEALLNFANNSEDYLGIMGDKLKTELIDNLGIALETVKELEKVYSSLSIDNFDYLNSTKQTISSSIPTNMKPDVNWASANNNISIKNPITITIQGNADSNTIANLEGVLEDYAQDIYREILKYMK